MASPTSISVAVDRSEYSKFEIERRTMVATVTARGGGDMSGEVITVQLRKARRLRDSVVLEKTVTLSGATDPNTAEFTINLLEEPLSSDLLNLIRRGMYFIRAWSNSSPVVTGDSSDFRISIITAELLRGTYLFGLELAANDVRQVRFQPSIITGVEVVEISQGHPMAFAALTYRVGPPAQLSWAGGNLVNIEAPGQYLLRYDCSGSDYMVIRVRSLAALPTENSVEELLVDKDKISDGMLQRWIDQACDWWENDKISVFLEPTSIVTDPVLTGGEVADYDFIVPPLTFYPVINAKWIDILFPYPGLLKVEDLSGQMANTRIVDVDLNWLEISERSGFTQLVPFNQAAAFQFIGLIWVGALRGAIELPNFWHFTAVAGLRQVDPVVLEILAKKAGIDALTVAGQAFRGGFASQSLSRDGVSESVSYTASAIYGIYSATIEDFNKFINREIKSLRGRYRGVNLLVA